MIYETMMLIDQKYFYNFKSTLDIQGVVCNMLNGLGKFLTRFIGSETRLKS